VSQEDESDFSVAIAETLADEAMRDKYGRGCFTVHDCKVQYAAFELVVTPEYGESAQAQRYRVTVELIKE